MPPKTLLRVEESEVSARQRLEIELLRAAPVVAEPQRLTTEFLRGAVVAAQMKYLGDLNFVAMLLRLGGSVREADADGNNALTLARRAGKQEILTLMLPRAFRCMTMPHAFVVGLNQVDVALSFISHYIGLKKVYSPALDLLVGTIPAGDPIIWGTQPCVFDSLLSVARSVNRRKNEECMRRARPRVDGKLVRGIEFPLLTIQSQRGEMHITATRRFLDSEMQKLDCRVEVDGGGTYTDICRTLSSNPECVSHAVDLIINNTVPPHIPGFVFQLSYLLFGLETMRNPASLIHNFMLLNLIISRTLTTDYEGDTGWLECMPMCPAGYTNYGKVLNNLYISTMSMPFEHRYDTWTGVKEDFAITLARREAKIVKMWLGTNRIALQLLGDQLINLWQIASHMNEIFKFPYQAVELPGYTWREVARDGNCMYNAVIIALSSVNNERLNALLGRGLTQEQYMEELRKQIDERIRAIMANTSHPRYSWCLNHIVATMGGIDDPVLHYTNSILRSGAWGDHLILQTIAEFFDIEINVHGNALPSLNPGAPNGVIHLYHHGEAHYDAYVPDLPAPAPAAAPAAAPASAATYGGSMAPPASEGRSVSGTSTTAQPGGFWSKYQIAGIDQLLPLRLARADVTICKTVLVHEDRLSSTVIDIPNEAVVVMPIAYTAVSKPTHAAGLIITKRAETSYQVLYLDSENNPIPYGLAEVVSRSLPAGSSISFVQKLMTVQSYSNNCGPELIENIAEVITGCRVTEALVPYYHSCLLEDHLITEAVAQKVTAAGPVLYLDPVVTSFNAFVGLVNSGREAVESLLYKAQELLNRVLDSCEGSKGVIFTTILLDMVNALHTAGPAPMPFFPGGGPDDDPGAGGSSGNERPGSSDSATSFIGASNQTEYEVLGGLYNDSMSSF